MNITTATPAQIDGKLAELGSAIAESNQLVARAIQSLHRLVGDVEVEVAPRTRFHSAVTAWVMSDADVVAAIVAGPVHPWDATYFDRAVTALIVESNTLTAARKEQASLDAEFTRRGGWNRFFLVVSSNGLIHSDTRCSTCNNGKHDTQFAWMTEQSGQTYAEAVEAKGPYLCQVCFPNAKAEWRRTPAEVKAEVAANDPTICPGSGKYGVDLQLDYSSPRGRCSVCGTHQSPNRSTGNIRKHKIPA